MIVANLSTLDTTNVEAIQNQDEFVMSFIPKKVIANEFDLYQTKWFDYRRMTGVQATCAYIDAFNEVGKQVYAREFDYATAKHMNMIPKQAIIDRMVAGCSKSKSKMTGMWKGRQVADILGMPYSLYISNAFNFRMRRWNRPYLPRPEHLYHEWDVEKIQDRWEETKVSKLFLPEDEAFLNKNYRGYSYQNDFHEWLFGMCSVRGNQDWFIADLVDRQFLPIAKVRDRVSEELFGRIINLCQTSPEI